MLAIKCGVGPWYPAIGQEGEENAPIMRLSALRGHLGGDVERRSAERDDTSY